jgi:hypothetical protein
MAGACLAALLLSCGSPTAVQPRIVLRADSAAFLLGSWSGARVGYTVKNWSDRAVTLATCNGIPLPTLEAETPRGWVRVEVGGCYPPYTPLHLAPGAGVHSWLAVRSIGRWRLRIGLLSREGTLVLSNATSPAFAVY